MVLRTKTRLKSINKKQNNMIGKVTSLEHLRELVEAEIQDFFIALNFGLRSSKFIYVGDDDQLVVLNLIDDSETSVEETNIPEAIEKGAFYYEQYD